MKVIRKIPIVAVAFGSLSGSVSSQLEPPGEPPPDQPGDRVELRPVRQLENFEVPVELFFYPGPPVTYLNAYRIEVKNLTLEEKKRLFVLLRCVAAASSDKYRQDHFLAEDTPFFKLLRRNFPGFPNHGEVKVSKAADFVLPFLMKEDEAMRTPELAPQEDASGDKIPDLKERLPIKGEHAQEIGKAFPLLSAASQLEATTIGGAGNLSRYAWAFTVIGKRYPELFLLLSHSADSVSGRVYGVIGAELFQLGLKHDRDFALAQVLRIWQEVTFLDADRAQRTKIGELMAGVRANPEQWRKRLMFRDLPDWSATQLDETPYVPLFRLEDINRELESIVESMRK